jgi:DHA1 family bicyclomycin/chloramphenicol resistance-like MFS transporter
VLAALPALSIDVSAPTLVLLQKALDTSGVVVGLTLSLFMGGFAMGQLLGGRSADRRGRRPVLLTGLGCYTAASIACGLSLSGPSLVVFRFAQGLGAGACSVLAFAIVQDLFRGDAARTKRSYVTVIFGTIPMLAPALGSYLSATIGWRAIYGALAIVGGLLLVVAWQGVAESRPPNSKICTGTNGTVRLRDDPQFVGLAFANALSYGCIFAYIAGSPVVIIGQMKFSSTVFSGVFACTAAALTAGAWVNGRLSRHGFAAAAVLGPSLGLAATAAFALGAA